MSYSIEVQNLSKQYCIGSSQMETTIREAMTNIVRHPIKRLREKKNSFWAIQDMSFKVEAGEVIGIIGRNGAGKSTLLKLLSKITYPTSGMVKVHGRAASMLEVGTGFHSELTGRENIYLNGSILGMKKREIDAKLDRIIAFAGVEKFIDMPIKRYSSGMELRLGFAVAAHLDADVLFVDEVLAVGDSEFQKKCLNAMDDMRGGGRTVLFVSHNMAAVENLCKRAIWIDGGRIVRDGPAKEVIGEYLATFKPAGGGGLDFQNIERRRGSGEARFTGVEFLDEIYQPKNIIYTGEPLAVRMHYRVEKQILNPHFGLEIFTDFGTLVASVNTWSSGFEVPFLAPGTGSIDVRLSSLNLMPGRYFISLWLEGIGPKHYDRLDYCGTLDVETSDFYGSGRGMDQKFGIVLLPCCWEMKSKAGVLNGKWFGEGAI
jgi:lipopolysaccharide transport system ATP-binding protein